MIADKAQKKVINQYNNGLLTFLIVICPDIHASSFNNENKNVVEKNIANIMPLKAIEKSLDNCLFLVK